MSASMRKGLSCTLVPLSAAAFLTLAFVPSSYAQGSAGPPVIAGLEKSEYCSFGDLLAVDGTNFGPQGDHGYVTISVPIADATGVRSYQDFPLSIKDWSDTRVRARLFMPNGGAADTWIATIHRDDGQIGAIAFTASPCPAQAEGPSTAEANQPLPVVYGFQKSEFGVGDLLIIEGANFGLEPAGGFVTLIGGFQDSTGRLFYREYRASFTAWTSTQIQVPLNLPAGAQLGTWVATVHRSDGETASQAFSMVVSPPPTPPSTPAAATSPTGTSPTTGTSPSPGTSPTTGTEDCLQAGDPVIDDFQKSEFCAGGDLLVIQGEHFCNDASGGWVTITAPIQGPHGEVDDQEFPASVVAWLSTQIQVQFAAPAGAVPGTYTVTVHVHRDDGAGNDVVKTASGSFAVVSCSHDGGE